MANQKFNKIWLARIVTIVIVCLALFVFMETRRPGCVSAQCIPTNPDVEYWNVLGISIAAGIDCVTRPTSVAFTRANPVMNGGAPGNFGVALTGWQLNYGSGIDHQWERGGIRILENTFSVVGRTVSFSFETCLADDGARDFKQGRVQFVGFAWE